MMAWLQDPMHLYAVAFIIFLGLAYAFGRKAALAWVDGEIAKIRAELDNARQLRADAEAALADCKTKQAAAEAEVREIEASAKLQIEEMSKEAEIALNERITRQEKLAGERIHLAETQAIADVRLAAVNLALSMARKNLADNLSANDSIRLMDQAIGDIPVAKADKVKAA